MRARNKGWESMSTRRIRTGKASRFLVQRIDLPACRKKVEDSLSVVVKYWSFERSFKGRSPRFAIEIYAASEASQWKERCQRHEHVVVAASRKMREQNDELQVPFHANTFENQLIEA